MPSKAEVPQGLVEQIKSGDIPRIAFLLSFLAATGCAPTVINTLAAEPTEPSAPTATATLRSTDTPTPSKEKPAPTATVAATEAPAPEPTVVAEFVRREVGGVQGEAFTVRRGEDEQTGWKYKMPSGETVFQIGYIDMLPDGSLADPDLRNEVVYYVGEDGERSNKVFLTFRGLPKDNADIVNHPNVLPFVQIDPIGQSYPEGAIVFMEGSRTVVFSEPFEGLQGGEDRVLLNSQLGRYEFVDKDDEVLRTIELFKTPKPAPEIAGLEFSMEEQKYFALEGNPYGLREGEYAGERVLYNNGTESGLALDPQVVKSIMEEVNTQETVSRGEWKIPMPLDPRGEEIQITKGSLDRGGYVWRFLEVKGLSHESIIFSPIPERTTVDLAFSPPFGPVLDLRLSSSPIPKDWKFSLIYPDGSMVANEGSWVNFGDPVVKTISGELTSSDKPHISRGTQILFFTWASLVSGERDFDITDNVLIVEGNTVFLGSNVK